MVTDFDDDTFTRFARGGAEVVHGRHDVEALHHFAEQGVERRETYPVRTRDEKNCEPLVVGSGVRHGETANLVAPGLGQLVIEAVARSSAPVPPGSPPGARSPE